MTEELIPVFNVVDRLQTARWYQRPGFELERQLALGMPLYLFLRCGHIRLHLSEHQGDARPDTLVYF